MSDVIPVHSLPKSPTQTPALKIFRFKNSSGNKGEAQEPLPITPLPTDAPHRHTYYEILFIEEGLGFHEIDFHSYPITGPGLHFLTPGQVHLLHFSTACQGYIVAFSEDFYSLYNTDSPGLNQFAFFHPTRRQPVLTITDRERHYFHNVMENMAADHLNNSDAAIIGKYLGLLIQKCSSMIRGQKSEESSGNVVPDLVGRFQEMVEKNFREIHEVQQYAIKLDVSPDYLSKMVKKHLGTPSQEYILDKLLLEAKRLLIFTNLSSKEIAYHVHIEDPSYFSRIFKKKTGLTPNDYREHVRKSTI